jgi:hypothetical protein
VIGKRFVSIGVLSPLWRRLGRMLWNVLIKNALHTSGWRSFARMRYIGVIEYHLYITVHIMILLHHDNSFICCFLCLHHLPRDNS